MKEESISEEKVDPVALLEKSEWYTTVTQNSDVTFEEQIDFNNDGTTEVLLGVTDTSAQEVSIYTGGFNSDSKEWSGIYEYALPYSLHATLNYHGTMSNGEDERLAAVSIFDASATGGTDTLKLLRYSSENESIRIIEAFNHPSFISEGAEPPVLNQKTNELTLSVFQENTRIMKTIAFHTMERRSKSITSHCLDLKTLRLKVWRKLQVRESW